MFWARQSKPRPLMRSWGDPGAPEAMRKKRWGLGKRKRDSILSLKCAGLHTRPPPHLGPKHAHLHMFTSTHSCPDHTRVCHSLSMFRLLKTYSLPDPLPLPSTHSHGGLDPWNTLRLEQGTRWHFCTLSNRPGLHPWVNKYFLNTYSSTNSFGALTVHQALF